jgi:hypothetical protein
MHITEMKQTQTHAKRDRTGTEKGYEAKIQVMGIIGKWNRGRDNHVVIDRHKRV